MRGLIALKALSLVAVCNLLFLLFLFLTVQLSPSRSSKTANSNSNSNPNSNSSNISGRTITADSSSCANNTSTNSSSNGSNTPAVSDTSSPPTTTNAQLSARTDSDSQSIKPPISTPDALLTSKYTHNGSIPMSYFYIDDSNEGRGTHYKYSEVSINSLVSQAEKKMNRFKDEIIAKCDYGDGDREDADVAAVDVPMRDSCMDNISKLVNKYDWLYLAIEKLRYILADTSTAAAAADVDDDDGYMFTGIDINDPSLSSLPFMSSRSSLSFTDMKVAVFGSTDPWVETVLLAYGVAEVVTFDYNSLTYAHERLKQVNLQVDKDAIYEQYRSYFDLGISMSSFDHDRYGDPLEPDGDLRAMRDVRRLLKQPSEQGGGRRRGSGGGGHLILSVPVGEDRIVFNMMRQYGPIRLPLLLDGYEVRGSVGFDGDKLGSYTNYLRPYEPVFLLQPSS